MLSDCHIHSYFSGDSHTPPELMAQKAAELEMEAVCFTDHHDIGAKSETDFFLDIPAYTDSITELKEEFKGKTEVLCGIELGLQFSYAPEIEKCAAGYPFDLIIGSVHFIDGLDPYYPEYFEKYGKDAYRRFFEETLKCVKRFKCYNTLGHLDYIVRYGEKQGLSYSYGEYSDYIDPILRQLVSDGKALECNTQNYSRGIASPNPCKEILRRYREMGGEFVTVGSDAHSPESMGCGFSEAEEMLMDCGFEYAAFFRQGTPQMIKLGK